MSTPTEIKKSARIRGADRTKNEEGVSASSFLAHEHITNRIRRMKLRNNQYHQCLIRKFPSQKVNRHSFVFGMCGQKQRTFFHSPNGDATIAAASFSEGCQNHHYNTSVYIVCNSSHAIMISLHFCMLPFILLCRLLCAVIEVCSILVRTSSVRTFEKTSAGSSTDPHTIKNMKKHWRPNYQLWAWEKGEKARRTLYMKALHSREQ